MTALGHVHHATGRSDDDVHACVELLGLFLDVRAAVDRLHAQPGLALERFEFFRDLNGELTGRGEHESLQTFTGRGPLDHWETKSGSLS